MSPTIHVIPQKKRRFIFVSFVLIFVISIPMLIFYASGYRLNLYDEKASAIVQTGGIYLATEQTGAQIFIDDELVRETRVFRKALYLAGVSGGVHRIHVQKDAAHTWVKELTVSPHLVTEAFSFNLPLVPDMEVVPETDPDYEALTALFVEGARDTATTTQMTNQLRIVRDEIHRMYPEKVPASFEQIVPVREVNGVQLFERDGDVFARYVGGFSKMPYYYCVDETLASTSMDTATVGPDTLLESLSPRYAANDSCDPTIRLDRQGKKVTTFDFYPGTTELVILEREDGIFLTEIDNRGWQNTQPILEGAGLQVVLYKNLLYVYDGERIYNIATGI